ncbi:ABC transporter ATP-binding protein [Pararhodospirillum oryzae]|uniref:ABC transporter n=1 Tax=Pararhodospirillum oryzae TaxID=478448 RepID=A0A512H7E4_9PROT|nr:ATP-binding cassette domain-containing protein [Pararhodospirillum oryzae]GEO81354.1 ABC transporter [Pararhodospirillum oryzae]
MPALSIHNLEVRYPGLDQPALALEAFDVAAGQALVVTGPSGAGKTTFLNAVTGLDGRGKGVVAWDGVNLIGLSETARDAWRARHVGLVMQNFHLFPGLSVLENVLLPQRLAHRRLPAGLRADALALLDRVGLERPHQRAGTLSRGQMQRTAVARALLRRPGIVVADEPTASLDPDAGKAVADLLIDLSTPLGATLIVASHDPVFLARLPRVVTIRAGRVGSA